MSAARPAPQSDVELPSLSHVSGRSPGPGQNVPDLVTLATSESSSQLIRTSSPRFGAPSRTRPRQPAPELSSPLPFWPTWRRNCRRRIGQVLSELRSIDLKAFRDFMEREFGLRGSAAQPAGLFPGSTLATTIFAGALYNADMFKRQGTLEEADASLIWSEVIDTLEGLSDEERSGRRLVGFFENLTS